MSQTFYLLLGLLLVILVLSTIVLYMRRNFKHRIKFLGASWHMETSDSQASQKESSQKHEGETQDGVEKSNVHLGEKNRIVGSIGDIAGRDITKTEIDTKRKSKPSEKSQTISEVNLGSDNVVGGNIGDIAGRDITKNAGSSE